MAWIDDKGQIRLFGLRINIIDFLVAIFILSLTPCFYYAYKLPRRANPAIAAQQAAQQAAKREQQIQDFCREHKSFREYFEEEKIKCEICNGRGWNEKEK